MLVLSRRPNDKVIFPHLGISVEILRVTGNVVRVGIEAPPEVAVVRHEIVDQGKLFPRPEVAESRGLSIHRLRNWLNKANLALYVMQRQFESGKAAEAEQNLQKALDAFQSLDEELGTIEQQRAAARASGQRSALLVEDDDNEAALLAEYLRLSGFEVDTAPDGCDALTYLSSHRKPDIVLLDMHLPRCDGPTTISAIRGNPRLDGMRVFAVSGTSPEMSNVAIGPAGVDRWFRKPINARLLVAEINRDLVTKNPAS